VVLPEDLIIDIDDLVGRRGRSAFLTEIARQEVRRRRLLRFLANPRPAWVIEDHPELKDGAAAWVHTLRQTDEKIRAKRLAHRR